MAANTREYRVEQLEISGYQRPFAVRKSSKIHNRTRCVESECIYFSTTKYSKQTKKPSSVGAFVIFVSFVVKKHNCL